MTQQSSAQIGYSLTKYQRGIRKIKKEIDQILRPLHKEMLNNDDFSIISNNCWGGVASEYFGLRKNSPTVGCYFFAEDYLKFISNLRYYLSLEIQMIPASQARHKNQMPPGDMEAPVGTLDDVEIVFLHYKDPQVAKAKWESRKARVNYDNLIVKFSESNYCTEEHLRRFDSLSMEGMNCKKIMFTRLPMPELKTAVHYRGFEDYPQVMNDVYWFNRDFDLIDFINNKGIRKRHHI